MDNKLYDHVPCGIYLCELSRGEELLHSFGLIPSNKPSSPNFSSYHQMSTLVSCFSCLLPGRQISQTQQLLSCGSTTGNSFPWTALGVHLLCYFLFHFPAMQDHTAAASVYPRSRSSHPFSHLCLVIFTWFSSIPTLAPREKFPYPNLNGKVLVVGTLISEDSKNIMTITIYSP